jgi:hypothetical protein
MIIVAGWLKEIAFFILNEKLYDNDVNAKHDRAPNLVKLLSSIDDSAK